MGFRVLGVLGFRVLGFWGFRVLGLRVLSRVYGLGFSMGLVNLVLQDGVMRPEWNIQ